MILDKGNNLALYNNGVADNDDFVTTIIDKDEKEVNWCKFNEGLKVFFKFKIQSD